MYMSEVSTRQIGCAKFNLMLTRLFDANPTNLINIMLSITFHVKNDFTNDFKNISFVINNEVICKTDLLVVGMMNVCNSLCNKYATKLTTEQPWNVEHSMILALIWKTIN
jgi:hypothetical protein